MKLLKTSSIIIAGVLGSICTLLIAISYHNKYRYFLYNGSFNKKPEVQRTSMKNQGMDWPGIDACTESELNSRSIVVLTTANSAFLDITANWLESIRRTRACPNIIIVAEDEGTYRYLSRQNMAGLNVIRTPGGNESSESLVIKSVEYIKFVNKRQGYILQQLERGREVFFCDVDTFWFRNPFPYLVGNFDIGLDLDNNMINKPMYCAGLVYFKPTEQTMNFVRKWIKTMESNTELLPDQRVMNSLISRRTQLFPKLKFKYLNTDNFPPGKLFYNETWRQNKKEIVVMHNNWIIGHDNKVERFRKMNMWLVNNNTNFTVMG